MTAVKVGSTTLDSTEYSLNAGVLTINEGVILTPGNHTIVVEATGYAPSTVIQSMDVGEISFVTSFGSLSPNSTELEFLPTVNVVTLTAKDQYNNPIPNYVFKHLTQLTDTDNSADTIEINEQEFIGTAGGQITFPITEITPTDADGVTTFSIKLPSTGYNLQLDIYLNDGTTPFF